MNRSFVLVGAMCVASHCCAVAFPATTLFRDDFSGTQLNEDEWGVSDGTFQFNRAHFGLTPTVSNGAAHFRLDTYNPARPGTDFLGTHVYGYQEFSRGGGLEFEARVRTNQMPSGIVTSFFTWAENTDSTSDEIDFEFLTSRINATRDLRTPGQPVALTTWNDWDRDPEHFDDQVHHSSVSSIVAGLDLSDFNTFTIRWLPDRTDWLVNGQLVRSTDSASSDAATRIFMNFWVPDNSWSEAYDAALQPVSDPAQNQSFYYDVDYLEVRALPEPSSSVLLAIAGPVGFWWLARRRPRCQGLG